jgi:bifunctional non-homologous end joining protein LigD
VSGRSRSWVKLKCRQRQEFVIGGYTEPRGSRTGFGALLLGVHESGGRLRYAGRVGTGFDEKRLHSIHERLEALRVAHSPFHHPPRGHDMHWVAPELVAEVSFAQWTQAGLVRQAVFHGLRADKPAAEIRRERPSAPQDGNASVRRPDSRARGKQVIGMHSDIVAGVRITHPDRVIDKHSGLTKIDLARYYAAVAPWMLPPLKARPVALLRGPEGIDGELFFQKHAEHLSIAGLRILDPKLDPGHAPLMVIDSVATLVGAVQMGAIEFHTWNATVPSIERPDRFVLDLDPDPSLPWKRVVEAAELTKILLDELGLSSFLKTSGGKGLHIVVPLIRRHSWDEVRTFTQAIARHLAANIPDRFSAKMGPRNRIKKVFVDYLRNRRGASTVASCSARARAGLTVSVPIAWEELGEIEGSNQWDIVTLPARLAGFGRDVWKNYSRASGTLNAAMKQSLGVRKSIAQRA